MRNGHSTRAPVPDGSRFFIPEVAGVLHGDEILLDAGAHHGSVIEAFIEQTKGAFRQIAAIEPDPSNRARLEADLQSWLPDDPRVTVYDCALAEGEGEALFPRRARLRVAAFADRPACASQPARSMRSDCRRLS